MLCRESLVRRTVYAQPVRWPAWSGGLWRSAPATIAKRASGLDSVAGTQQSARQIMADNRFGNFCRRDGGLQVDVDIDIAVTQQVHQILGGDVAGGSRCE